MVFLNTHVYQIDKNNYLLADSDIPLSCIPREDCAFKFVGGFEPQLEKILEELSLTPEKSYELGEGILKHMSHLIHLTPEKLKEVVESQKAYVQKEKGTHSTAVKHFEELEKIYAEMNL